MANPKTRVVVIGDSHAKIFSHPIIAATYPHLKFVLATVSGATVSGFENPNSKTQALPLFRDRISKANATHAVVMLGEVDTGFVIWHRARKYGLPVHAMLDCALANYQRFLIEISEQLPVLCISTPLPTIKDGSNWGEVENARSEIDASQSERTELTLRFNSAMQKFCFEVGIRYLMLDLVSIGDDGLVRDDLINVDPMDHHYSPEIFAKLVVSELQKLSIEQPTTNEIYLEISQIQLPHAAFKPTSFLHKSFDAPNLNAALEFPDTAPSILVDRAATLQKILAKNEKLMRRYADAELLFLSFPKSGRTWARTAIAHYLSIRYQLPFDIEFEAFSDHITRPCFTHNFFDVYRHVELQPKIVEEETIRSLPLIMLIRDPRDVCASYFHHIKNREKMWNLGPVEFAHDSIYGIERQVVFVNQLLDLYSLHPGPKLLIQYEQLRRNPIHWFRKMISMIDHHEVDEESLMKAVEFSRFERMQEEEKNISHNSIRSGPARIGIEQWNGDVGTLKVRRGKVGGYFSEFGYLEGMKLSLLPTTFKLLIRLKRLKWFGSS